MDPLSDVLSLLKPRNYMCGGFDMGGAWSVQFPRHDGIKCYAVVSGQCWLSVEGVPDAVRLGTGDCFLLPGGRPFCLASDLALTPVDFRTVFPTPLNGGIAVCNGGGNCFGVGGYFAFTGNHAGILLGVLPPIVHIRKESDKAAMRWSLERMRQELREPQAGGFLVAQHLASMMLVQALHRWTLQKLAERAGMSRSTFALRFKETVGEAPMEYLTRWRMLLAGDKLTNSGDPVSVIAPSLGYESESAFSTAFRRVMGCSPRQYGRGRKPASPPRNEAEAARADRLEPAAGR
jgi:AraC-like DNA-binding protein